MTPATPEVTPVAALAPPETGDWVKRAAAATLAVGMLAGCTEGANVSVSSSPSVAASASATPETHMRGPCSTWVSERTRAAATKCEDAMKAGRVALVSFTTVPLAELAPFKTDIPDALRRGTGGLVNVSVEIVPASDAAKALFKQKTGPSNCVDHGEPDQYASTAAEATMPELEPYDYILGISDLSDCEKEAQGVADPTYRRDADVFEANATDETMEAIAAAHEIGHLDTLGHAGRITGVHGETRSDLSGLDYSESKRLDLKSYLAAGEYDAYGGGRDGYLMGSGMQSIEEVRPNPMQQVDLQWPKAVLGQAGPLAKKIAGKNWQAFHVRKSAANSYGTIKLPEPMAIKETGMSTGASFNRLNLVPAADDQGFYGVEIVVSDQYNNLASLGRWYLFDKGSVGRITIGGSTVEFKRTNSQMFTRVV